MVKKYLDSKKLSYTVVNLDSNPERREEAVRASGGALTVPVTVISSGKNDTAIVGWNPAKLNQALVTH